MRPCYFERLLGRVYPGNGETHGGEFLGQQTAAASDVQSALSFWVDLRFVPEYPPEERETPRGVRPAVGSQLIIKRRKTPAVAQPISIRPIRVATANA